MDKKTNRKQNEQASNAISLLTIKGVFSTAIETKEY
jgi:hypothetical protein